LHLLAVDIDSEIARRALERALRRRIRGLQLLHRNGIARKVQPGRTAIFLDADHITRVRDHLGPDAYLCCAIDVGFLHLMVRPFLVSRGFHAHTPTSQTRVRTPWELASCVSTSGVRTRVRFRISRGSNSSSQGAPSLYSARRTPVTVKPAALSCRSALVSWATAVWGIGCADRGPGG